MTRHLRIKRNLALAFLILWGTVTVLLGVRAGAALWEQGWTLIALLQCIALGRIGWKAHQLLHSPMLPLFEMLQAMEAEVKAAGREPVREEMVDAVVEHLKANPPAPTVITPLSGGH